MKRRWTTGKCPLQCAAVVGGSGGEEQGGSDSVMSPDDFFECLAECSAVKTAIVTKYFLSWASIIGPTVYKYNRSIAYVDLFSGPGVYNDGSISTPLQVLTEAIRKPELCLHLRTYFNDINPAYMNNLHIAIQALPGIANLAFPPQLSSFDVSQKATDLLDQLGDIPIFSFLDPFGYKGISLNLINTAIRNWGSDCIFFFNYNRINAAAQNDMVMKLMEDLFGQERARKLRRSLDQCPQSERELTIIEAMCEAIKASGTRYILPFKISNRRGTRISHHLVFVSKHPKGYEVMKNIMAGYSSGQEQGVATFEYNIATSRQPFLAGFNRPLDALADDLVTLYAGCTMEMVAVFEAHNLGTPYVIRNYKDALLQLETERRIQVDPPAEKRRKIKGQLTLADKSTITFPK